MPRLDCQDFTKIEPMIRNSSLFFQRCRHCKKEIEDEHAYCDECYNRMNDLQQKILYKQGAN